MTIYVALNILIMYLVVVMKTNTELTNCKNEKFKEIMSCLKSLAQCFGLFKEIKYRTVTRTDEFGDKCIFTIRERDDSK